MCTPLMWVGVRRPATPGRSWAAVAAGHAVTALKRVDTIAWPEPSLAPPRRSNLPSRGERSPVIVVAAPPTYGAEATGIRDQSLPPSPRIPPPPGGGDPRTFIGRLGRLL